MSGMRRRELIFVSTLKKPGITITEHAYNPYTQAKNLRYVLIDKGYQFLLAESNLRIYVVHPWFNHINYTSFLGSNSTFFRSLARRGFCQLTKDSTPIANAIASGWTSRPVSEAACRLSAVLFLVDCTVEKKHEKADVREARDVFSAYLYLNPNSFAENRGKLELGRFVDRADKVLTEFDDFDSDNY
jgi:hypothetical protein